jgi:iron complex transport system permease protein
MKIQALLLLLVGLCLATMAIGLAIGSAGWLSPVELARRISSHDEIVLVLRAPRVLMVAIVGASLAIAGAAMQVVLRNDLADPYVLGLSGGASLGAVGSLAAFPGLPAGPMAAVGAAAAAFLVRAVVRGPYDPTRMLLGGIAVGSVLASITGVLLVLAPPERLLRAAMFWLFGGVGTPPPERLVVPAALLVAALVWLLGRAETLDRLLLGDDVATTLGVNVPAQRRAVVVVAVLLTAASVAVAGLIGFVGLMAPHAARRLVGSQHRRLLPVAALLGALLVSVADTLARTLFAPRELPVGLVTAAAGGPFFLWLLGRRRTTSWA